MAKEKIKFLHIRQVKSPQRAFEFDAGIDFFVPEFNIKFIEDLIKANPETFKLEVERKSPKFSGRSYYEIGRTGISLGSSETATISNIPIKNHPQDFFGFDIEEGNPYLILMPGEGVKIPSGIKSRMIKHGRALIAANKSGIATRNKLSFGAQIIDYLYKGEIHLHLINNSNNEVKIYQHQKIIQFLETPIFNSEVELHFKKSKSDEDKFYDGLGNDRGEKGFGSSDKNL